MYLGQGFLEIMVIENVKIEYLRNLSSKLILVSLRVKINIQLIGSQKWQLGNFLIHWKSLAITSSYFLLESSWVGLSRAELSWVDLSQAESGWVELSRAESSWVKMSHAE